MADQNEILKKVANVLASVSEEKRKQKDQKAEEHNNLIKSVGKDIAEAVRPLVEQLAEQARTDRESLKEAISNIEINPPSVEVRSPEIPKIVVPEPKVTVNIPPIKVPEVNIPNDFFDDLEVSLKGVKLDNPLPVQLRDVNGKPVNLLENLTTIVGGGGGGFAKIVRVSNLLNSTGTDLIDQVDNALRVVSVGGSGGLSDTELRASSVPVAQASGAIWSVNVAQQDVSQLVNQVSGAQWSTSASQVGTWTVDQLSGATWSVYAQNPVNQGDAATALRVVIAGNSDASVSATQVGTWIVDQLSGANWSVFATNPVNQGDTATALRVVVAGDSAVSVSATQVGTWTVALSGSLASAVVTGPSAIGVADDGTAPVQIGGIARTTNPTKVTDGQVVKSTHDAVGRQLVRPVQVRGLLQTAYLSLTTGTEATLLAGIASTFLDLIYVMGTNSSDAAVTVDLRSATGAGIQTSIRIPANGTAGVSLSPPIPQDVAADTWTADMPDITGTTVTLSALFSKEL